VTVAPVRPDLGRRSQLGFGDPGRGRLRCSGARTRRYLEGRIGCRHPPMLTDPCRGHGVTGYLTRGSGDPGLPSLTPAGVSRWIGRSGIYVTHAELEPCLQPSQPKMNAQQPRPYGRGRVMPHRWCSRGTHRRLNERSKLPPWGEGGLG
jgi:hypothetical protein